MKKFGSVFRRSNLLTIIDEIDEAILNTRMAIKVQQRLIPSLGIAKNYNITFPVALAVSDDTFKIVTSSRFTFNSKECTIENRLNSSVLQIVNTGGGVEVDNIGSYNTAAGRVDLVGFNPTKSTLPAAVL